MPSRRRVLATSLRTTAVLASASCAHPDFPYAAEKPGSAPARPVDVKVPPAWTAFPPAQIAAAHTGWSTDTDAAALLGATARQESCGASDRPSHAHVLGRAAPDQPVDYASLRPLHQQEQPGASTDRLTGLLLAVTSLGSAVAVRSDSVVSQGRATGVHLVVSSAPGWGLPEETIDQTAHPSDGKDAVHLLAVRCTTSCYDANRDQIAAVTSSFTIQEGRSG